MLKLFKRSSIITRDFLNKTVKIHNGMRFVELLITDKMLGHCFGEYSATRKFAIHKKKNKKK